VFGDTQTETPAQENASKDADKQPPQSQAASEKKPNGHGRN